MRKLHATNTAWIVWFSAVSFLPILAGIVALARGQQMTWDLASYHAYNGYAFLNHRLEFDIAPAGIQTFLNPALDVVLYWMISHLVSTQVTFVLGFVAGLNLSILFLIFWKIAVIANRFHKFLIGAACVLVSFIAPGFLSELGTTFYDNVVSIFVLLGLLMLVFGLELTRKQSARQAQLLFIGAGFVMGLGIGLKFVIAIYAAGAGVALATCLGTWRNRILSAGLLGTAALPGFLISAGFWLRHLWLSLGNPFFPFFNGIFRSPYIAADWRFTYYDGYVPRQIWEYMIWPLIFSRNGIRVGEQPFADIRFGLLYLLLISWIVRSAASRYFPPTDNRATESGAARFLLVFAGVSFVLWMVLFSYYRFLLPLELLVPILFLILLERLFSSPEARVGVAVFAILAVFLTFVPLPSGSLGHWTEQYLEVGPWPFPLSSNTVVVMLGPSPMGYVIPAMPPQIRFVRPDWNYVGAKQQGRASVEIKQLLQNPQAMVYVLYNNYDTQQLNMDDSLGRFHLRIVPNECVQLKSNVVDSLVLCRLSRSRR